MAVKTGTHTIADLAESQYASTPVMEFGLENLAAAVQADLDAHNALVNQMVSELADVSPERSTVYGTSDEGTMVDADEFTRGPTQKPSVGGRVEFPLGKKQYAVGWTNDYFKRASVQDLARMTIGARKAHVTALQLGIQRAIYGPTNYSSVDRFRDGNTLAIKRFLNADGTDIPNGPNGETFTAGSHTHYDFLAAGYTSAQLGTALVALVNDVVEHGHGGKVRLYINRANEAAVRATPDFDAYVDPRIIPSTAADSARGTLDLSRLDNRAIGILGAAEVWVKPWAVTDYPFAADVADPRKPLRMRISTLPSEQGLQIAAELHTHPLNARFMEAFFGFGVLTRTNGAVLNMGQSAYVDPGL